MINPDAEQVLEDLLRNDLDVVFCGTQAGAVSAQRHAYYAGPGNRFWTILHESALVPSVLVPHEYRKLLDFRIGLTDVAKCTFGPDAILRRRHFRIDDFRRKIADNAPRVVAFNGKKAASAALGIPSRRLGYGLQAVRIGRSSVFVLPSTSGAARAYWSAGPWMALSSHLGRMPA